MHTHDLRIGAREYEGGEVRVWQVYCVICDEAGRIILPPKSATGPLDVEPDRTLLRLLHHASAEHLRVFHGSIPVKDRRLPLRELINATDLAGEHLDEPPVSKERKRRLASQSSEATDE